MKICFVHEEYPLETNFGGIATYQKIMAEYYANHGDIVYVVTRGNYYREYTENNVHVIRVASDNNSNDIESVKEYRKKVAKVLIKLQNDNKIDIIETPDWGANTIYFEKYRRIPLVVRLHTPLKIWLNYNNNNFGISKDILLKWENTMLKNADTITSCSQLLKDMVINQYAINKKIIVIPNPYNNKDFCVTSQKYNNNLIYVGSLEERKGVILFAKALNKVLDIIDDNCVYIVGKDTNRNSKNISTKEYMLDIIDKKYHDRIKFVGQIDNTMVNEYLNESYLAVFPSIFDNYPYTILEAMASGRHIICSDNIGSADLVKIHNYTFKTNDYNDMIDKIFLLMSEKREFINYDNVKLVNDVCNQDYICKKMRTIYSKTIKDYNMKNIDSKNVTDALKKVIKYNKIKKIKKISGNLANFVYVVFTDVGDYIVKKYNYDYDFNICNEMYDIYESNGINFVRPINKNIIVINEKKYNVFKYLELSNGEVEIDYINKLININRRTDLKSNVILKCNKYYKYLVDLSNMNKEIRNDEFFVIDEYEKIKDKSLFNEQYLNHGDLSLSNIIFHDNCPYVIDFDETIVTTKLYDYAVVFVKIYLNNTELNYNNIMNLIIKTIPDSSYSIQEYLDTIKFYLCKILLEKFYLYETKKIDLFSKIQLNDSYKKYVKILRTINSKEIVYE